MSKADRSLPPERNVHKDLRLSRRDKDTHASEHEHTSCLRTIVCRRIVIGLRMGATTHSPVVWALARQHSCLFVYAALAP
jgi:hypothetical protein